MTTLSLAARNTLAQDPELKALLGRSVSWSTWIFDEDPLNVHVENTSRSLIVINEGDPWTSSNGHNTMTFPSLVVDIWSDPSRNSDKTVKVSDARTKIFGIKKLVDKHFHLVDSGTSQGLPWIWGTAAQIASRTGVVIAGSHHLSGPSFSPIRDTDGAYMGRIIYAVNQVS